METPVPWSVLLACVIAIYMVLSACTVQPQADLSPVIDAYHERRSLAFDAASQRILEDRPNGEASTDLPWYLARNDQRQGVTVGIESPKLVQSVTWRRDHQHTFGDRVIDNYTETTWTRTYREQLR